MRVIPLLFLGVLLLGGVRASAGTDLQGLLIEANSALTSGSPEKAVKNCDLILKEAPDAVLAWMVRAKAKRKLKDTVGALADSDEVIKLAPRMAEAYRLRAEIRLDESYYHEAWQDIDKAVELEPDFAPAYRLRARIRYQEGGVEMAIVEVEHAIKLDPKNAEGYRMRAELQEEAGNVDAALADFTRTIEINPKQAGAYDHRAWLRFHQGDWTGALEDSQKHNELRRPTISINRVTGYVQFAQGDYAASIKSLTAAADMKTDDDSLIAYSLFVRHLAMLRSGTADDRLEKATATWEQSAWWTAVGKYLTGTMTEGELDKLAVEVQDGRQEFERGCEANYYIGMYLLQAGDTAAAGQRFRDCVAANRKDFVEHTLAELELKKLKQK